MKSKCKEKEAPLMKRDLMCGTNEEKIYTFLLFHSEIFETRVRNMKKKSKSMKGVLLIYLGRQV